MTVDLEQLRQLIATADYDRRQQRCCKVCGAVPDNEGDREHGRGCYTLHDDGGGSDHVDVPPDTLLSALPGLIDELDQLRRDSDPRAEYRAELAALDASMLEDGFVRIGRMDDRVRRSLWLKEERAVEGRRAEAFELRAGREGDDAYVRVTPENPQFEDLANVVARARYAADEEHKLGIALDIADRQIPRACPCMHTRPCHDGCTCVHPLSSSGCHRCCTYGSPEQQRETAVRLVRLLTQMGHALSRETLAEFERMAEFLRHFVSTWKAPAP